MHGYVRMIYSYDLLCGVQFHISVTNNHNFHGVGDDDDDDDDDGGVTGDDDDVGGGVTGDDDDVAGGGADDDNDDDNE